MGSLDLCSRLGATTQQECDRARVPLVHLREVGSMEVRAMSWDSPAGKLAEMMVREAPNAFYTAVRSYHPKSPLVRWPGAGRRR